jgi:hypothetical protein
VLIPVVGMTEASRLTACLLGCRFGQISFRRSSRGMYLDLVQRTGLAQRMISLETTELTNSVSYLRRGGQDAAVMRWSWQVRGAGIAHRLRAQLSVLLLDGIAWAIGQACCRGEKLGGYWDFPPRVKGCRVP